VVSLGVTPLYKDTDHPLPIVYLLGQITMVEETIVKGVGAVAEECHASLFITAASQVFQYVQQ